MGSVMPLTALWEILRDDFDCIWIGTKRGIERSYITALGLEYRAIPAGKLRHYFSLKTLFAPFFVLAGLFASLGLILFYRPKKIIVSGSFVSVPLVWAGWLLRVPIIAHQEDLRVGLAGRLTLPFARKITTAFPQKCKKCIHIGNPVRKMFKNPDTAKWRSVRQLAEPLILVLGGSQGAEKLNQAMAKIAPKLAPKARILHLTGKNKTVGSLASYSSYQQAEGLWNDDLAGAIAAADIVVARAGLATIGELAALGKPAILVPLSGVGQNENARYLENKNAAVISGEDLEEIFGKISALLSDKEKRDELSKNIKKIFPPDAAEKLADIVKKI